MAEASGEMSIKRRNPFSFLDVCCFSLFLMLVFSLPGYCYCLQHPPRWNQTSGFSRPCTWSVCCFLCHILCPAVQTYVCLLVFVEAPWHYNFKEIQRMEVISPTSWMNTEKNQDDKGVLQPMLSCFGDIDRKSTWKELSEVLCKDTRGNKDANTTFSS